MNIVVCALAKNEHLYINEWVNHYLKLGFDKIYIYDNDEHKADYIGKYIDNKEKVEIIDIRGVKEDKLQQHIYTAFYHSHTFDYCLFCDIDEFLFGIDDIHEFLKDKSVDQIRIKWKLFGDDNRITRDMSKPVVDSFKIEVKHTFHRSLNQKGTLERQGKAIVRGSIEDVIITSPHFASKGERNEVLTSELPSGKPCHSKVIINEDYKGESVYLHHYMTKTLSEFVNQKLARTDAVYGGLKIDLKYYWRVNKITPEKILWLKERKLL